VTTKRPDPDALTRDEAERAVAYDLGVDPRELRHLSDAWLFGRAVEIGLRHAKRHLITQRLRVMLGANRKGVST
jgi:hypothetical protein